MSIAIWAAFALGVPQWKSVTVPDAEKLVSAYVKVSGKAGEYWNRHPKLKDITPKEVADRLHGQVFKRDGYTGNVTEPESYFIRRGKAYPLCTGFGGDGLTSMCVCDLDRDKIPELVYTYSWGSGIHRSHLEGLVFSGTRPVHVSAPFVVGDMDLKVERTSDDRVKLYTIGFPRPEDVKQVLLGNLTLRSNKRGFCLDMVVDANLGRDWRKLIWRSGPRR